MGSLSLPASIPGGHTLPVAWCPRSPSPSHGEIVKVGVIVVEVSRKNFHLLDELPRARALAQRSIAPGLSSTSKHCPTPDRDRDTLIPLWRGLYLPGPRAD
jgi:hypothetical protein